MCYCVSILYDIKFLFVSILTTSIFAKSYHPIQPTTSVKVFFNNSHRFTALKELNLPHQLLVIGLFVTMLAGIFSTLTNYILGFSLLMILVGVVFSVLQVILLYFCYVKKQYSANLWYLFVLSVFFYIIPLWFLGGGLLSGMPIWYLFLVIFFINTSPTAVNATYLGFFVIVVTILINILEYSFPHWVIPYKNQEQAYWDMLTSFYMSLIVCYLFLIYAKKSYDKTQDTIQKEKLNIQIKNRELFKANLEKTHQTEELLKERNEITKLNEVLQEKQKIIEQKNADVWASISYASRIQKVLLPTEDEIRAELPKSFLWYLPKNIVSGDFTYFQKVTIEQKTYLVVAVADCTGHGVSGCLMSIMGINILNQIVTEYQLIEPKDILTELDKKIRAALKQENTDSFMDMQDGMDIALCIIAYEDNSLRFAGSKRPLWQMRANKLTEIAADRLPIGGSLYAEKIFTQQTITLQKNDRYYLFSDGITDQLQAKTRRRFSTKHLRIVLSDIQDMELAEQKPFIEQVFLQWQGSQVQTDDIVMFAFEFINFL